MPVDPGATSVFAAVCGLAGIVTSKLFDYAAARLAKQPADNAAFRAYLEGEIKKLKREVSDLRRHVLDCERDRAVLSNKVRDLERENAELRVRLEALR